MIKLHSFGPAYGLIDASPFVTKVNLFMTVHKIPFESVNDLSKLAKAPKQKFPYIEDSDKVIADSTFIIEYLSKKYDIDMDSWLSDEQRATAYLIGKSLEENLYWCLVHSRWVNDDTWPTIREHFFASMPFPLNKIIPFVARRGTIKRLKGHGMGLHSNQEILQIAKKSFVSLSKLLGGKPFFFGEKISSLDIIAFAQLSAFTLASLDNPINRTSHEQQNLLQFTTRIQYFYFPNRSGC